MLYFVTMTHTPGDCPGYNRDQMPEFLNGLENLDNLARELKVTIRQMLWAAPEHSAFLVIEADGLGQVAQYVNAIPIRQEFHVTPVQDMHEVIAMGKAMMARAKK